MDSILLKNQGDGPDGPRIQDDDALGVEARLGGVTSALGLRTGI